MGNCQSAAIALVCAYVPSALGRASFWSLGLGVLVIIAVLFALARRGQTEPQPAPEIA